MDQIHAFALFFVIEESAVDKFSEKKLPTILQFSKTSVAVYFYKY